MKAIVVTDQAAGTAGMKLVERPEPQGSALASLSGANYGDVIVQVHASGFTGDELSWPSTWIDRLGRDRTPSIPGHELAGVVTALCRVLDCKVAAPSVVPGWVRIQANAFSMCACVSAERSPIE